MTRSCSQSGNLFCAASGGRAGTFHLQELSLTIWLTLSSVYYHGVLFFIPLSLIPGMNTTYYSYMARILQVIKRGYIFGPNAVFLPPQPQVSEPSSYTCSASRHLTSMIIQLYLLSLHFYTFPRCSSFDVAKTSAFISMLAEIQQHGIFGSAATNLWWLVTSLVTVEELNSVVY